jgi:hypothetical protein
MLQILERSISEIDDRLVLLAPPGRVVHGFSNRVALNGARHQQMVAEMQTLRGSVYLEDGAISRNELTSDGRHETPEDDRAWHLLMLNREGRVSSCAWYLEHARCVTIEELRVKACPLNTDPSFRGSLHLAIERELAQARQSNLGYGELGGWAVTQESRCTSEVLMLALATYGLVARLGGALGLTTATVRHASSTILRRLGGSHLEVNGVPLPTYYDEKYRCDMEVLRFDSRSPNPKYQSFIDQLKHRLAHVAVIATLSGAQVSSGQRQTSAA